VALYATSTAAGVHAESKNWHGVYGLSESTTGGCGVLREGHARGRRPGWVLWQLRQRWGQGRDRRGGLAAIQDDGGGTSRRKTARWGTGCT